MKNNKQILTLLFLLFTLWTKSQRIKDSLPTKIIYNSQLKNYLLSDLLQQQKPIIVITNANCGACVDYFAKHQRHFLFLFVTNSLSLLNLQSTVELYKIKANNCYFIKAEEVKIPSLFSTSNPAPCILNTRVNPYAFFNYKQSDSLTNGFTLPFKKLIKRLNRNF